MASIEDVEQGLRDALPQLYNPTYRPPSLLWSIIGVDIRQGPEVVQSVIIAAIETLKPAPDIPPNTRVRRLYELLSYRYLQGLTQKETAQRLGITPRHLRREQNEAVRLLAEKLRGINQEALPAIVPAKVSSADGQNTTAWRSQVRQELALLQQNAPGTVTDVNVAIQGAVKSGETLTARHKVSLNVALAPPGELLTTVHPAILRELLLTAIEKLVQSMSSGEITLTAEREKKWIKLTVSGYPTSAQHPPYSDFIQEVTAAQGGAVQSFLDDEQAVFLITLPIARNIRVAVVEDNRDLVHFYQNYTTRTHYQIEHVTESHSALEKIIELAPDIIVIDIMLPDIDGWELLSQLQQHPATRLVPVIICSVVRREELALAHGAALYLQKPVRRQQFIEALDQVSHPVATAKPKAEANRPISY